MEEGSQALVKADIRCCDFKPDVLLSVLDYCPTANNGCQAESSQEEGLIAEPLDQPDTDLTPSNATCSLWCKCQAIISPSGRKATLPFRSSSGSWRSNDWGSDPTPAH